MRFFPCNIGQQIESLFSVHICALGIPWLLNGESPMTAEKSLHDDGAAPRGGCSQAPSESREARRSELTKLAEAGTWDGRIESKFREYVQFLVGQGIGRSQIVEELVGLGLSRDGAYDIVGRPAQPPGIMRTRVFPCLASVWQIVPFAAVLVAVSALVTKLPEKIEFWTIAACLGLLVLHAIFSPEGFPRLFSRFVASSVLLLVAAIAVRAVSPSVLDRPASAMGALVGCMFLVFVPMFLSRRSKRHKN